MERNISIPVYVWLKVCMSIYTYLCLCIMYCKCVCVCLQYVQTVWIVFLFVCFAYVMSVCKCSVCVCLHVSKVLRKANKSMPRHCLFYCPCATPHSLCMLFPRHETGVSRGWAVSSFWSISWVGGGGCLRLHYTHWSKDGGVESLWCIEYQGWGVGFPVLKYTKCGEGEEKRMWGGEEKGDGE